MVIHIHTKEGKNAAQTYVDGMSLIALSLCHAEMINDITLYNCYTKGEKISLFPLLAY